MLCVYVIQERYSDNSWHMINCQSARNGIFVDKSQALTVYHLMQKFDNPKNVRMIDANLTFDSNLLPASKALKKEDAVLC